MPVSLTVENIELGRDELMLIVGDFNINMLKRGTYQERLNILLLSNELKQYVKDYSHISINNQKSLIDLVIGNHSNISCTIFDDYIFNNHALISIILDNSLSDKPKKKIVRKPLSNIELFQIKIRNIVIDYRIQNINLKYKLLYDSIVGIIDEMMPKCEISIGNHNQPWFTSELKYLIHQRNYMFKKYTFTNENDDNENYKTLRNQIVKKIRVAKRIHYEQCIDENRCDPKNMWKTLNKIIIGKNCEHTNEIEFNKITFDCPHSIAENFNNYFIDSILEIVSSIPKDNGPIVINKNNIRNTISDFKLIDYDELRIIIFSLPNKTSPDDIKIEMYKYAFDEISNEILHVINFSLETGEIPEQLKISTIVPIPKISHTNKSEHFRPVNMLPTNAKILEKVVFNQLLEFVISNNILSPYQSGFRQNFNCETALQCLLTDWRDNIDEDKITIVVFFDLKRAFETINRQKLIEKLSEYSIKGNCLKWFKSYLQNRKQCVKWNDAISKLKSIINGVPQGSILGPLLFIIYINDIEDVIKWCCFHLFADDMVLYITGTDEEVMRRKLEDDIERIRKWLIVNGLKLNTDKTKYMIFAKDKCYSRIRNNFKIQIENCEIELVNKYKYLGIIIDRKLNLNEHFDYVFKKISKKIGVLRRCRYYLSDWAAKTVYNTIIHPHFHFAGTLLYTMNQNYYNKFQMLQNKVMRILLRCNRYTSINDMLCKLNWMNVISLFEMQILIFIHKAKMRLMPKYIQEKLKSFTDVHSHDTRNKNNFILSQTKSKQARNSVFFKGFQLYNKLPNSLKVSSFKSFKNQIREHYLSK